MEESIYLSLGQWVFLNCFRNPTLHTATKFFCFFYTAVTFQPVDVADNLKKQQANIPGIRPGKQTAEYIDRVLVRITLGGALYVSAVCVLPAILMMQFNVPFYFGGTALLIVVGVQFFLMGLLGEMITHTYHESQGKEIYAIREIVEAIQSAGQVFAGTLRVDGGLTKSDSLMQLQADLLGVTVQRPAVTETTALGAAYLAGLAVGYWPNLEEIAAQWQVDAEFAPSMSRDQRDALYAGWQRAVGRARSWIE